MRENQFRPILYVDESSIQSGNAVTLLTQAGLDFEIKTAPLQYRVAYLTPVLFGLSNRYEGIEGVKAFVENATLLGRATR